MAVKLNFHQPLLQSHDPSEIILICGFGVQEPFLLIINVENSCFCLIFLYNSFNQIFLLDSFKIMILFFLAVKTIYLKLFEKTVTLLQKICHFLRHHCRI